MFKYNLQSKINNQKPKANDQQSNWGTHAIDSQQSKSKIKQKNIKSKIKNKQINNQKSK